MTTQHSKFTKRTITIYTDKAKTVENIPALCLGGLAYHKALNHSPGVVLGAYVVTHIASGCKIAEFGRQIGCRFLIERIKGLVDWEAAKDRASVMAAMTPEKVKEFHRIRTEVRETVCL